MPAKAPRAPERGAPSGAVSEERSGNARRRQREPRRRVRLCRYGLRSCEDRHLGLFGEHDAEDLLERQQVGARCPALEVVAGAAPLTGVERDVMRVVVATERERETVDRDAIELSSVAIRLLDLADQGAVHRGATSVALPGACGAAVRSCTSTGDGGRVPEGYTRGPPTTPPEMVRGGLGRAGPLPPEVVLETDDVVELRGRHLHQLGPLDRLVAMD